RRILRQRITRARRQRLDRAFEREDPQTVVQATAGHAAAGDAGEVLHAFVLERRDRRREAAVRLERPEALAGIAVERGQLAVEAAGEDQTSRRRDRARAAAVEETPPRDLVIRQVHRDERVPDVGADVARAAERALHVTPRRVVGLWADRRVRVAAAAAPGAVAGA